MKIRANAKINLSLCVCGKRKDGYHLIDTIMHSVGLFDEITLEKADQIIVECSNSAIKTQDNIAFKAAKLFFEDFGIIGGCKISINKNIPTAAGLGGGSADAAAVLLGLDKLYSANIPHNELCKTALKLGADVPFFIDGGCQRAEGIGEILTPLKPLKSGYILLAKADSKPSTAQMYRILDSKETVLCDTEKIIDLIKQDNLCELSRNLYNAFGEVWTESQLKQILLELSPLAVSISGSGPTWFAIFYDLEKAKKAESILKVKKIDSWLTCPQEKAIIFE